jgi:outer membrane protein assembly factor BamD
MRYLSRRALFLVLTGLVAVSLVGCGGPKEDPILALSAEESLEEGKALMEAKKYLRAGEYLTHAFEVAPNSAVGREALLLAADALYLDGGVANFIKAEAKYRDFQNRFPTSERSDYVQLQIANSLSKQIRKPDRDQSPTHSALNAYEDLIRLYPASDYAEEARQKVVELRQGLAEHEFIVGRYNFRRRLYPAAIARLETLTEQYPDYAQMDKVLYFLGMAHRKMGQPEKSAEWFDRLRQDHPQSSYVEKIPAQKKSP